MEAKQSNYKLLRLITKISSIVGWIFLALTWFTDSTDVFNNLFLITLAI